MAVSNVDNADENQVRASDENVMIRVGNQNKIETPDVQSI